MPNVRVRYGIERQAQGTRQGIMRATGPCQQCPATAATAATAAACQHRPVAAAGRQASLLGTATVAETPASAAEQPPLLVAVHPEHTQAVAAGRVALTAGGSSSSALPVRTLCSRYWYTGMWGRHGGCAQSRTIIAKPDSDCAAAHQAFSHHHHL